MTIAVNYAEGGSRDGSSPRISYQRDGGNSLSRKIRVKGSDAELACRQAVGWSYPAMAAGFPVLRRELPEVYPRDHGFLCKSAGVVGFETWDGRTVYDPYNYVGAFFENPALSGKQRTKDPDTLDTTDSLPKVNRFKHALIELSYDTPDFAVIPDAQIDATPYDGSEFYRFMTRRVDRAAKHLVINQGSMYWVKDVASSESVPFAVGKIEVEATIYYKQWGVADGVAGGDAGVGASRIPWTTINGTMGRVNKDTFDGYPPGSLLYLPPRVNHYMNAGHFRAGDIEHVILHVPQLHNRLLYVNNADKPMRYLYISGDDAVDFSPNPAALPDGKFLYDGVEFWKVFVPRFG